MFLHSISVEMGRVPELNGISGAPVFLSRRGVGQWAFAGVLVRGNAEGLAHFVDCRVVVYVMWKHRGRGGRPARRRPDGSRRLGPMRVASLAARLAA